MIYYYENDKISEITYKQTESYKMKIQLKLYDLSKLQKGALYYMAQTYPMTPMGKKRLKEELAYLKEEKQREINDEIKHLRGFCDFSDDVSFNEKLEQQSLVQERISMLEEMLYNVELINPKHEQASTVMLGSTVTFMEIPDGDEETYTIVGTIDANPTQHNISTDSPIGKGLLGSKINDKIFIEIPSGKIKVEVIDIR